MLRFRYKMTPRNLPKAEGRGSGPAGRISKMRKLVTALVRHERIEGKYPWLDESRGYAERLLQEALRHGDTHKPTMELADYWLLEKDLVHKLFKVLVPRFHETSTSFTKMWNLPTIYPGSGYKMAVLELKGNPWPPVLPKSRDISKNLINVLLGEAKADYRSEQVKKRLAQIQEKGQSMEAHSSWGTQTDLEGTLEALNEQMGDLEVQESDTDKTKPDRSV